MAAPGPEPSVSNPPAPDDGRGHSKTFRRNFEGVTRPSFLFTLERAISWPRFFLHVRVSAAQAFGGENDHHEKSGRCRAACRWHFASNGAKRPTGRWPTASGRAESQYAVSGSSPDECCHTKNAHRASGAPRTDIHAGTAHDSGLHRRYAGKCYVRLRDRS
jgi:hypothetical protein